MRLLAILIISILLHHAYTVEKDVAEFEAWPVHKGPSKDSVSIFATQFVDVLKGKRKNVDIASYANLEAITELANREAKANKSESMKKEALLKFQNGITKGLDTWLDKNKKAITELEIETDHLHYLSYSTKINPSLTFDMPIAGHMSIYLQHKNELYKIDFHELYFVNGTMVLGGSGKNTLTKISK